MKDLETPVFTAHHPGAESTQHLSHKRRQSPGICSIQGNELGVQAGDNYIFFRPTRDFSGAECGSTEEKFGFSNRDFFLKVFLIEDTKEEKTVKEPAKGAIAAAGSSPADALQRRLGSGHRLSVCRSALFCPRSPATAKVSPDARTKTPVSLQIPILFDGIVPHSMLYFSVSATKPPNSFALLLPHPRTPLLHPGVFILHGHP